MAKYSADDGLKILTYLGLTNLTPKEQKTFKDKWPEMYAADQNLIDATWKLYAQVLPFVCAGEQASFMPGIQAERASFLVSRYRDKEFGERLKESPLERKLKKGMPLEKIFKESPERFAEFN